MTVTARAASAWVATAAVATGLLVAWAVIGTHPDRFAGFDGGPFPLIVAICVGWALVASGLLAWQDGRHNPLGPVLVLTGFAWMVALLTNSGNAVVYTAGEAFSGLYAVGFVYLVLSFPSGRLQGRLDRVLVWGSLGLVTVGQIAWQLFADSDVVICGHDCPDNLLEVTRRDDLATALGRLQQLGGLVVAVVTLVLLAVRWRRASAPQRDAVRPVVVVGLVAFGIFLAWMAAGLLGLPGRIVLGRVAWYAVAAVPFAVLVVFAQRRLARGAVARLVVDLGSGAGETDLRTALATALGDSSLALAYWYPAESRYVDVHGLPVDLPQPASGRASTVIERAGQPVAVLVHDPALEHNADLVASVCAAAGLSLENARLQAELRARLVELQASRARLVEATDAERRRIERDLHDGTQQRLVSIAMSLGLVESTLPTDGGRARPLVHDTRQAMAETLAELRALTKGINPPVLAERGLPGALDELAGRAALPTHVRASVPERLAQPVETAAYFVVSEAVTNAAKHAHATEVRVRAEVADGVLSVEVTDDGIGGAGTVGGTGLRGLADRVEALGGRFTVSSPPGRGTRLLAEIPCG